MMTYLERARAKARALIEKGRATLLAVESSCDETAVAVVKDGRQVLANEISSQVDIHALYGGVVPEIASRMHVEALSPLYERSLAASGLGARDIDAVAVTFGPGLVGALLTGVSFAKALAYGLDVPLVAVNHIEGHVSANFIAAPSLEPPFVCLVASGGHSHIVNVTRYGCYELLGRTVDDAAGEAFDKVARVLEIPYPGGPLLDKLAETGDEKRYRFPRMHTEGKYDYSFSGLKTAVINQAHTIRQNGGEIEAADWAASFRRAVVDALLDKALLAARDTGAERFALAGGVASNRLLRRETLRRGTEMGLKVFMPPASLCTDNAAMIGAAGFYRLMNGELAGLDLNAQPSVRLIEE
ncbi:MAG: tRNA (adenosine(37)-N6)-threonylcarbamoyltransferase complex transferase subunit TsaD [Clostridia bacterium]|nr:tRNA (adenosine(37)-N6)-threonylcarbamoyltransferase complex transferase subunit TsaD [Clostridia bacterium]